MKKYILCTLMLVSLLGCTKDDICSENTPTTPLLIITFKDLTNSENSKTVSNLQIKANDTTIVFNTRTTDSIAIPLKTFAEITDFSFIKDADNETDMNEDVFSVAYSLEDVFINRACGFKTVFNNINANVNPEAPSNLWIKGIVIKETKVENELQAHINILH